MLLSGVSQFIDLLQGNYIVCQTCTERPNVRVSKHCLLLTVTFRLIQICILTL